MAAEANHNDPDSHQREAWRVVAALFVTVFFVFGAGIDGFPVFLKSLLKEFGWDRYKASSLYSALLGTAGIFAPISGWLLDRIDARIVISAGALIAGISLLLTGFSHSFTTLMIAQVLMGIGTAFATSIPCAVVVSNWFKERRGMALGITLAGTALGGMVLAIASQQMIVHFGWRVAYRILGIPPILIAAPLVIWIVRTRPPTSESASRRKPTVAYAGLRARDALRERSFWMVSAASLAFGFSIAGVHNHIVVYLIDLGYGAATATMVLSAIYGLTCVGKLIFGGLADRIGARKALFTDLLIDAVGLVILLKASHPAFLAADTLLLGIAFSSSLVLDPLVLAESVGLREFGLLSGLMSLGQTLGGTAGPIAAGRIFDKTHSYTIAFLMFASILVVGAFSSLACVPLNMREDVEMAEGISRELSAQGVERTD